LLRSWRQVNGMSKADVESEIAPTCGIVLYPNPATMRFHRQPTKREPQPAATRGPLAGIELRVGVKNELFEGVGNPLSRIDHPREESIARDFCADMDSAAHWG